MTSFHESIAAEIQRYCASHPDAGDTLDGIVWWLMQQRFQDTHATGMGEASGMRERQYIHHSHRPTQTARNTSSSLAYPMQDSDTSNTEEGKDHD